MGEAGVTGSRGQRFRSQPWWHSSYRRPQEEQASSSCVGGAWRGRSMHASVWEAAFLNTGLPGSHHHPLMRRKTLSPTLSKRSIHGPLSRLLLQYGLSLSVLCYSLSRVYKTGLLCCRVVLRCGGMYFYRCVNFPPYDIVYWRFPLLTAVWVVSSLRPREEQCHTNVHSPDLFPSYCLLRSFPPMRNG